MATLFSAAPQSGWFHNNAERYRDWVPVNDKSVNPVPATATPFDFAPDGSSMTIYTLGPAYAGWLAKKTLPVNTVLSTAIVTATWDVWPTPDSLRAQAWEMDRRYVDPHGNVYALDLNYVLVNGGMFQSVNDQGNGWINTGTQVGLPPAGLWTTFGATYALDTVKKTSALLGVSMGSQSATIANPQYNPALPLNWQANSVVWQAQVDENAAGETYGWTLRNINVSAVGSL